MFLETKSTVLEKYKRPFFDFEIIAESKKSRARVGKIYTPHGVIPTPCFVPVGTNGAVKGVDSVVVDQLGVDLLFCNTYHLLLQPGVEVVEEAGGLHAFMGRKKPIITDSGGFQVFSLAYGSVADELKSRGTKKGDGSVLRIDEEGVVFRSYRDGRRVLLTPETSVEAQKKLGADIIIPFDELPPYHISQEKLQESFDRTHRWEKRSLCYHKKRVQNQAMYSVVHGGVNPDLRRKSCEILSDEPFDGFAIGGSLGKTKEELYQVLAWTTPYLDPKRPRHLLGIGDLASLEQGIPYGIDTFDSSYPTKAARHGVVLTSVGKINLTGRKYERDRDPIEKGCDCFSCTKYSRAYLTHLYKAHELSFYSLASIHNLRFMVRWMEAKREAILQGKI